VSETAPRILYGATHLAPGVGGIARVARMTARALIERGQVLDIVTLIDREPVEIAGLQARRARGSRLAYLALCQLAARRASRAVYDSVGMARAHPRLATRRVPYATWIHGIEVWYGLHADRRRALAGSSLVLANSRFTLAKLEARHGPLERAKVCWLATEDDDAPAAGADFEGPPLVLSVGRIDADQDYKGHRELVAAWPKVVAAVPEARLVLAGGGTGVEAIRALARSSPAATSIDVQGFVPESEIPSLWRKAHVFAMPSRNEGFGIVYAEAMRCGLPVIASVHDGGREVNIDGETGYNVDLNRPAELTERIIALLRDRDLLRRLGAAGLSRWHAHFRYSVFADRLASCMQGFLDA
jgi:phosphatidylinositol alpha-1,6-mannosyltransferase